jgi:co-chaperonin GroES (HSP10)
MAVARGRIKPIRDRILVTDIDFGDVKTASGIIIPGADGKTAGIHPRWGRVWAVGPEQKDVKIGEWIMIEHGRWTRKFEVEDDDGNIIKVHGVDNKAIMMSADEKPEGIQRGEP